MSTTPDKVVLTGATGFIGSAVLAELLQRGIPTVVLLRPESDLRRLQGLNGYEILRYHHLDEATLQQKLREHRPTVLLHCAWRGVAGHERNEAFQVADNLPLTVFSVKLAASAGCQQWVGLGSQAEYGNLNRVIAESAPTLPTTIYGKAKLAASIAALAYCEAAGLAGAWLRVFSTYGPGDAPQWMIPYVIREFLQGRTPRLTRCEQLWDYLYVADAARAIVSTADGSTAGIFNLGSGQATPLKQIIETIRTELGTDIEPAYGAIAYRPDQVMHLQADISKLRAATGWSPQVGLTEGVRAVVDWEKKHFEDGQAIQ